MTIFTPDQWLIVALFFVLGLLIGAFLTYGGRRKWKTRYHDERKRVDALEREGKERDQEWAEKEKARERELAEKEKEWRERDSLRAAAAKDRRDPDEREPL